MAKKLKSLLEPIYKYFPDTIKLKREEMGLSQRALGIKAFPDISVTAAQAKMKRLEREKESLNDL